MCPIPTFDLATCSQTLLLNMLLSYFFDFGIFCRQKWVLQLPNIFNTRISVYYPYSLCVYYHPLNYSQIMLIYQNILDFIRVEPMTLHVIYMNPVTALRRCLLETLSYQLAKFWGILIRVKIGDVSVRYYWYIIELSTNYWITGYATRVLA